MEFEIARLEAFGLNIQDGLGYTGNQEKYLAAIQRYMKSHEKYRGEIVTYLETGDMEGYRIRVHSLKSNSKMIGARELSKSFEELEEAAARTDADFISTHTPAVLQAYDQLVETLSPIAAIEDVHPVDEISAEVAKNTAQQLLDALDEYDDELATALIKKLSGYPFRISQQEKLKNAKRLLSDFLYEDVAELIRQILPAIE